MTAGKATGPARDYQVLCRDVLQRRFGGHPYSGDGVDVPFEAAGTKWTIDVALRGGGQYEGSLILAECRARKRPQEQSAVAAFAFEAEKIRAATGQPVAAFFMAKVDPQEGALKVQPDVAMSVVVVNGTDLPNVEVAFLRYDREREKKIRNHLLFIELGAVQVQVCSVGMVVTAADGSTSDPNA